jgi:translation initiation factor 1A
MGGKKNGENIRYLLPKIENEEMFAVVDRVLAASRMKVSCADGKTRLARIPGGKKRKMKKIRTGDLLIITPWDIQDEKADIIHKYKTNQARYLSREDFLPEGIDIYQK